MVPGSESSPPAVARDTVMTLTSGALSRAAASARSSLVTARLGTAVTTSTTSRNATTTPADDEQAMTAHRLHRRGCPMSP